MIIFGWFTASRNRIFKREEELRASSLTSKSSINNFSKMILRFWQVENDWSVKLTLNTSRFIKLQKQVDFVQRGSCQPFPSYTWFLPLYMFCFLSFVLVPMPSLYLSFTFNSIFLYFSILFWSYDRPAYGDLYFCFFFFFFSFMGFCNFLQFVFGNLCIRIRSR